MGCASFSGGVVGETSYTTQIQVTATRIFKPSYLPMVCCQGPLQGGVCAQRFRVDLRQLASSDPNQRALASKRLELLHVDHTYDVQHIVDTWKRLSQRSPSRWDFGVDASKLCALLFGVSNYLTFRCAVPRLGHQCPCHHVARPHYHHTLNPIQLKP